MEKLSKRISILFVLIFLGFGFNAQAAIIADLLDEPFNNLSAWQDHSLGSGYGEIDPAEHLHLNSTIVGDMNVGGILHFVPNGLPDDFIVEIKTYIDVAGFDTGGAYQLQLDNGNAEIFIQLRKDGLFINDSFAYTEIGNDLVKEQKWQMWKFIIEASSPINTTCDAYLNGGLLASNVPCNAGAPPVNDGLVYLGQYSYETHTESHTDYIKLGTFDSNSPAVPEPSTILLITTGLLGLAFKRQLP